MAIYCAVFTESEMMAVKDSLSEETVRMRRHVRQLEEEADPGTDLTGARKRLNTLEALLTWAKRKQPRSPAGC